MVQPEDSLKKFSINIDGMTCASCEVLIERRLKKIDGIKTVKVNHHQGLAEIYSHKALDLAQIQQAIEKDGYSISDLKQRKNFVRDLAETALLVIIVVAVYLLLLKLNFFPDISVGSNMSLWMIFAIGLIASTSTCIAVTGGLLIALTAKFNEDHPKLTGFQKFKPHIFFNVGRIISYTLLGGLLGLIGSVIAPSQGISGFIIFAACILMIVLGIQMLNLFPFISKLHFKLPKFIAHRIYDETGRQYRPAAPFALGAASFFLPCGFTQALQLYVLAKGSFEIGALTMLVFSIGTMPALISLGALSSVIKGPIQKNFMRFAAVMVIVLGILTIPSALNLMGFYGSEPQGAGSALKNVELIDGIQVARMRIVGLEYIPSKFTVMQGIPVKWEIDATQASGCAHALTAPKIRVAKNLVGASNVITFTPENSGKIPFSCTMGMTTPGAAFEVMPSNYTA